ncbi:hypothetical protein [Roseomonas rosulenta]|uniref:hypothetical protein n=1 Tax=Roseomonas rosulenta TaxID=2748667 RepID=UPI0018E02200|nr:hypothetical protein [Roseomonas rosulenta]
MSSVTVMVPMSIRRRGGRKQIIGPDGAPVRAGGDCAAGVAETRGDPALVKALARAFRWRRMLEEGRYASIRELAAAENAERTFVARVVALSLLAPDIVEAVLQGHEPAGLTLASFRQGLPTAWEAQRAALAGFSHRPPRPRQSAHGG